MPRSSIGAVEQAGRLSVAVDPNVKAGKPSEVSVALPVRVGRRRSIENEPPSGALPDSLPLSGQDTAAAGRAEACYKEEFDKWQAQIDAVANDVSLSRGQRAAGVAALRERQRVAANAARRKILEEEKQKAKAVRGASRPRNRKRLLHRTK